MSAPPGPAALTPCNAATADTAATAPIAPIAPTTPPARALLRQITPLAAPTSALSMLQVAAQLVETWLAARQGTAALASWAVLLPLALLLAQRATGAMGGGVVAAVARALGGQRRAEAQALVLHAMLIATGFGLLFAVGLSLAAGPLLQAVAGPDARSAVPYALWLFGVGAVPALADPYAGVGAAGWWPACAGRPRAGAAMGGDAGGGLGAGRAAGFWPGRCGCGLCAEQHRGRRRPAAGGAAGPGRFSAGLAPAAVAAAVCAHLVGGRGGVGAGAAVELDHRHRHRPTAPPRAGHAGG